MDTGVFAIEHPYPIDGTELMQCLTSTLVELKGLKEENLKVVTLQEWVEAAESTALVAKKQDVEDMVRIVISIAGDSCLTLFSIACIENSPLHANVFNEPNSES